MKAVLLTLALTTVALAADPFYPKALGQGEARSVTKDTAKFSLSCAKLPPTDYQLPFKGGIKVIVTTPAGLKRTINMPEVEDADFLMTRCTFMGKGTLTVDYGKGQVKEYKGTVRATVVEMHETSKGRTPDKLSIAFRASDIKIPQTAFQGDLVTGNISVSHPRIVPIIPKKRGDDGDGGGNGAPPPR